MKSSPVGYPHGPVVPLELFEDAQKILAENKKYNCRIRGTVYFLSGILFFEDGAKFTGAGAKASEFQYYHCLERKVRISKSKLEGVVLKRVREYLSNSDLLKKVIDEAESMTNLGVPLLQEEVAALQKRIGDNRKVIDTSETQRSVARIIWNQ